MEQQETLRHYIERNRIRMTCEMTDHNPNMDDGGHTMRHYTCTLRRQRRHMTITYSMGIAICREPTAEDVLDCLASDAAGFHDAAGFEEWAREYGYDTDSRKAERIYHTIDAQALALRTLLGEWEYELLLRHTKRL